MTRSLVFLGDEDRAKDHAVEALSIAASVAPQAFYGRMLSDGTRIEVSPGVITIESEFMPEYIVMAPKNVGGGAYRVELCGYNHRSDAMIAKGQMQFDVTYSGYGSWTGPEAYYLSDGVMVTAAVAYDGTDATIGDSVSYVASVAIAGGAEDLLRHGSDTVNAGGFPSAENGHAANVSFSSFGDNYYTVSPYGVGRADVTKPIYQVAMGTQYEYGSEVVQTYNTGGVPKTIKYAATYQLIPLLRAQKGVAPQYDTFYLADDILIHPGEGGDFTSAPFPIVIPLGNQRVLALYRKIAYDPAKFYGGVFSLEAKVLSGTHGASLAAVATSGITTSYLRTTWNFGAFDAAKISLTAPLEVSKVWQLFRSLAYSQRSAVPLSQDQTVLLARRTFLDYDDDTDDENTFLALTTHSDEWVCLSASPSGIGQIGLVKSYWSELKKPGGAETLYRYDLIGTVGTGSGNVLAYFARFVSTAPGTYIFTFDTIRRFASADGGATWDGGISIAAPPVEGSGFIVSPPFYVGNDQQTDAAIIGFGVTSTSPATGGKTLDSVTLWTSKDGGVTFTLSKAGAVKLDYFLPTGEFLNHQAHGLTSVVITGNHEDGYAPSPYRHLPTYYGTPTKASRDAAVDPNQ